MRGLHFKGGPKRQKEKGESKTITNVSIKTPLGAVEGSRGVGAVAREFLRAEGGGTRIKRCRMRMTSTQRGGKKSPRRRAGIKKKKAGRDHKD